MIYIRYVNFEFLSLKYLLSGYYSRMSDETVMPQISILRQKDPVNKLTPEKLCRDPISRVYSRGLI